MLREGDTSPTDIPKFFGARTEMEALSGNGGVVGSFSAACKPNIMQSRTYPRICLGGSNFSMIHFGF